MKKTFLFLLMLSCSYNPILDEDVDRYNLFLMLRTDRDVQRLYLSKVYSVKDSVRLPVEAEASLLYKNSVHRFVKRGEEVYETDILPIPGEMYSLHIEGECGTLDLVTTIPESLLILNPERGDTLHPYDTIVFVSNPTVKLVSIIIGEQYFAEIVYPFDTVRIPIDSMLTDTGWVNMRFFGYDSAYLNYRYYYWYEDTLKDYYGIFTGAVVEGFEVYIPHD